jgi:peptidyl-prolyl cis-trans isomerase A (cyclophilin A)
MFFRAGLRAPSVLLASLAISCKTGSPPEPAPRQEPAPTPPAAQTATATATATADPANAQAASASATAAASASSGPAGSASAAPTSGGPHYAKPVAQVPVSEGDPAKGVFTLADATSGLAGKNGKLVATMVTDKGTLKCELWPDKAPITVANFVGLARGVRPWKTPGGDWVKKPLYDGTPFHRIIRGFMVQGGDPKGNGSGDPGYVIPDEVWEGAHHDARGLICMANRGPNTNGSQFFIMDGVAAHLDGGYTIFGKCGPDNIIEAIAGSEVAGDHAVNPPKIKKLTIERVKG